MNTYIQSQGKNPHTMSKAERDEHKSAMFQETRVGDPGIHRSGTVAVVETEEADKVVGSRHLREANVDDLPIGRLVDGHAPPEVDEEEVDPHVEAPKSSAGRT